MEENKIKKLLEKYFEGLTCLEEEQCLRDYFQEENIPEEWEMYRPIFQFFSDERAAMSGAQTLFVREKRNKRHLLHLYSRISVAAAACFLLFFGLRFMQSPHKISQVYIDGKKYTNIEVIRKETLMTLINLSEGNEEVYSSQIEALEQFF